MSGYTAPWSETQASAANTAQTLSHAAETGRKHLVTGIIVQFTVATPATPILWELRDGDGTGTVILSGGAGPGVAGMEIIRSEPLTDKTTVGSAVTLTVAAAGATIVSRANLIGFTI